MERGECDSKAIHERGVGCKCRWNAKIGGLTALGLHNMYYATLGLQVVVGRGVREHYRVELHSDARVTPDCGIGA